MVRKKYEPNKEDLTPASNGRDKESLLKTKDTGKRSPNNKTVTVVKDEDIHELSPLKPIDEARGECLWLRRSKKIMLFVLTWETSETSETLVFRGFPQIWSAFY